MSVFQPSWIRRGRRCVLLAALLACWLPERFAGAETATGTASSGAIPANAAAAGTASAGVEPGNAAATDITLSINPRKTWGTWEGWGCSLAWWAVQFGMRDDLADTLFTTKPVSLTTDSGTYRLDGLGFNAVRYNIGGTSSVPAGGASAKIPERMPSVKQVQGFWISRASDGPASKSWDWSVDANQRAMLQKARKRGVNRFEAFSDSPMWWMCRNNSTAGSDNGGDNLRPEDAAAFAKYLAIVTRHARDHWGIAFQTVEPFNEPSTWWWKYPGGQEGCHFDIATQEKVIGLLRKELDARGLKSAGIAASDENSVDEALRTWETFVPATKRLVTRVNVHGYYGLSAYRGPNRPALYLAVSAVRKPLWVSEYAERDGTGRTMAESLALDINRMHVTGWVYWQPFDSGGWGLVQSNHSDNWIGPPNPKYSVMAQFSRHIRPGMAILESGDSNTVAAYDAKARKLVLVSVNLGDGRWLACDLSRFARVTGSAARWLTTMGSGDAYKRMPDVSVSSRTLRVWQPGNTVQTLEVWGVKPSD